MDRGRGKAQDRSDIADGLSRIIETLDVEPVGIRHAAVHDMHFLSRFSEDFRAQYHS